MKFQKAFILLFLIFFSGCSLYYSMFKKESEYYSPKEIEILEKTLSVIDCNYGYDVDVELDYIYSDSYGKIDISKKGKAILEVLKIYTPADAILFYEKIYLLKTTTELMMKEFKEDEDWPEYTHLEKYLLPPISDYLSVLEKQILKIDLSYNDKISERKLILQKLAEEEL